MVQFGRSSRSSGAKSERSSFGRTVLGKAIRESSIKIRLGKSFKLVCLFVNREKGLILSVYVDYLKLAGKKQSEPNVEIIMKDVDMGEPTSFLLDHVYLGCTQRECQISKDIADNYRNMFESSISVSAMEKLPVSEKSVANISSRSCDMEGHAKTCVETYCELANKTTQQLRKVATPCLDDHLFKEKDMASVEELSKVCSQIVLKCLYLARSRRLDILLVRKQICPYSYKMD